MKFRQTRPLAYHINMQASTFPEAKRRRVISTTPENSLLGSIGGLQSWL